MDIKQQKHNYTPNCSEEEKMRLFNEGLKDQKPYVEPQTVKANPKNDGKNCIDFDCKALCVHDACLHRNEIYNPSTFFACNMCEIKGCNNCLNFDKCENQNRRAENG